MNENARFAQLLVHVGPSTGKTIRVRRMTNEEMRAEVQCGTYWYDITNGYGHKYPGQWSIEDVDMDGFTRACIQVHYELDTDDDGSLEWNLE